MKNWLNSLSIRNKLTLSMTFVCLITISISTLIITTIQISNIRDFTIENSNTKAELIGASAESAILFDDSDSAYRTLGVLKDDPTIIYSAIMSDDGSVLAEYESRDSMDSSLNYFPFISGSHYLEVVHNIQVQDETVGYVLLRVSLEKFHQQVISFGIINVSVLLFSIFLAYVLANYFQKIITVPINSIIRHMEKIHETNDYNTSLKFERDDELGKLVAGFNHLLSAVRNREEKLSSHSEHLQELVDDRTRQLEQKAHYDSLTELPNRYLFYDRLNQEISTSKRENRKLALLFLDLDRFKIINDSLGHVVGDQLLQSVASRLNDIKRDGDTVARLGGDEFVFLLHNITKAENAARVARRIIEQFSKPFELSSHTLHVSTSIGISIYPADGEDNETLLKNADASMYHAKEAGRGQYCYFTAEMNETSSVRLNMENQLRKAIENNEFSLVYQPIINLKSGAVESLEALIRWNNSELGFVPPDEFISIAEDIGLIDDIGHWVIKTVCCQLAILSSSGYDKVKVAVNISASHIMNLNLLEFIKDETRRNNVRCEQLKIEITEDVFLNNSDRIIDALTEIRNIGVDISIDDFGTGYSSLRYIQKFPVDTLKIDGMFIRELENNESSRGIVSSTILLAHSLGLAVVCECVETKWQLDFLQQENCDYIQGYYFSKPIPEEEIPALLSKPFQI